MSVASAAKVCITRLDISPYNVQFAEYTCTLCCRNNFSYSNNGAPMGTPNTLTSLERAIMHASFELSTATGLLRNAGLNTRSQETKKLLQSTRKNRFTNFYT